VPEPAPEPETVTHVLVVVAVQVHVDCVVTVIEPDVPVAGALISEGVSVKVHDGPDCVTVNDLPAIVSVADRGSALVLAATLKVTVPDPVPVVPETLTHAAPLDAVQLHVDDAVTVTVPLPPLAGNA
jgi:hypothetical protein